MGYAATSFRVLAMTCAVAPLLAGCLDDLHDADNQPQVRVYSTPFPAARLNTARRNGPTEPAAAPADQSAAQTQTRPTTVATPITHPARDNTSPASAPTQQAPGTSVERAPTAASSIPPPPQPPAETGQGQTQQPPPPATQSLASVDTTYAPASQAEPVARQVSPPPPVTPVAVQPLRDQNSPEIRRYVGQSADAIVTTFGQPARRTASGTGSSWAYESGGCRMNIMIFPEISTGRPRVAFAEMQVPSDTGATTQDCISHLRASRR